MSLTDRTTRVRDAFLSRYGGKVDLYGLKRSLWRRVREESGTKEIEILPRPTIYDDRPEEGSIEGMSRIRPRSSLYRVPGVSRSYRKEDLEGNAIDYLIREEGQPDILCELVELNQSTLAWDLVLQEKIGEGGLRWE